MKPKLRVRLEFKKQDCWIGVYWDSRYSMGYEADTTRLSKKHRERGYAVSCERWDVWICIVPMLPIHISRVWR